jgi:Zn-dependent protease with chaperone function
VNQSPSAFARGGELMRAVLGAAFSLGFLAVIVIVWAAQIRSCFSSPTGRSNGPAPRALLSQRPAESRLATHLASAWQATGQPLNSASVWMLDDTSSNAASLGGGAFVLWKGLEHSSDESLDAILAHEIAHDQLRHARNMAGVKDVSDFAGEALGTLAGGDEGTTRTLKQWSGDFIIPHYSQRQELEADSLAVVMLGARGFNEPAAMVCRTFAGLRSIVGEAGGGFFATHPGLSERIATIRRAYPSAATSDSCR